MNTIYSSKVMRLGILLLATCLSACGEISKSSPEESREQLNITFNVPTQNSKLGGTSNVLSVSGKVTNTSHSPADRDDIDTIYVNGVRASIAEDSTYWHASIPVEFDKEVEINVQLTDVDGKKFNKDITVNNQASFNFYHTKAFDQQSNIIYTLGDIPSSIVAIDLATQNYYYVTNTLQHEGPALNDITELLLDNANNRLIAYSHESSSLFSIDLISGLRSTLMSLNPVASYNATEMVYEAASNSVYLFDGLIFMKANLSTQNLEPIFDFSSVHRTFDNISLIHSFDEQKLYIASDNDSSMSYSFDLVTGELNPLTPLIFPDSRHASYGGSGSTIYSLIGWRYLFQSNIETGESLELETEGFSLSGYTNNFITGEEVIVDTLRSRLLFFANDEVFALSLDDTQFKPIFNINFAGTGQSLYSPKDIFTSKKNVLVLDLQAPGFLPRLYSIDKNDGTKQFISQLLPPRGNVDVNYASYMSYGLGSRFFFTGFIGEAIFELHLPSHEFEWISSAYVGEGERFPIPISGMKLDEIKERMILVAANTIFSVDIASGDRTMVSGSTAFPSGPQRVGEGPDIPVTSMLEIDPQANIAYTFHSDNFGSHLIEVDLLTGDRSTVIQETELESSGELSAFTVDLENKYVYYSTHTASLVRMDLLTGAKNEIEVFNFNLMPNARFTKLHFDTNDQLIYAASEFEFGSAVYIVDTYTGQASILAD